MSDVLFLWRESDPLEMSDQAVQRMLESDADVEGLSDLPIREILDRLKSEFHGCREEAGTLAWDSNGESFRATWSWQYLRIESINLNDEHRDRFFEIARSFGCPVYDPRLNVRMGA